MVKSLPTTIGSLKILQGPTLANLVKFMLTKKEDCGLYPVQVFWKNTMQLMIHSSQLLTYKKRVFYIKIAKKSIILAPTEMGCIKSTQLQKTRYNFLKKNIFHLTAMIL